MKKIFICLLINVCFLTSLNAQLSSRQLIDNAKQQTLRIAVPDTSNRGIFRKNSGLKMIFVSFLNNQPYYLIMRFENVSGNYDIIKHYDLAFEGDAFVFKQKQGLVHLLPPKVGIQSLREVRDTSTIFTIHTASVFRDTIAYSFSQRLSSVELKEDDPIWIVGMPAKFKGELRLVEEKLAKQFSAMEHSVDIDSILVFSAKINKAGSLSEMELIAGNHSAFSDLIQKEFVPPKTEFDLLPPRADWNAARIDAGPKETKVKIYARLNPDGSIAIRTPRRLRTFSGE